MRGRRLSERKQAIESTPLRRSRVIRLVPFSLGGFILGRLIPGFFPPRKDGFVMADEGGEHPARQLGGVCDL